MTDSGESINRTRAFQYSPVWRAVMLVSSTIAKVPCDVFVRTGNGKEKDRTHPAYSLLRWDPNNEQTAYYWWQTAMGQVLLDPGNAYSFIERDNRGNPTKLIPLDPLKVTPTRANGVLWYVYTPTTGKRTRLDSSSVLHFKGLGFNGLVGYSVLAYARNSIGQGVAAQKSSNKFFANNSEARIILEVEGSLKQEAIDQIKAEWNGMHQGLDNAYKTAILGNGITAKPISLSARDSQLIETLKWSVNDIANWFGVPPHKIGSGDRTAYNSLESENQAFLDDTVDAWFVMIEQECRDKLMTEAQKAADSHFVEFNRAALVRANLQAQGEFFTKALAGYPYMTVNEVRTRINLNGIVDGDTIKPPTNNFSADDDSPAADPDTVPDDDDPDDEAKALLGRGITAAQATFTDVEARMVKRLLYATRQAIKKAPGAASVTDILEAVCTRHKEPMQDALTLPAQALAALDGGAAAVMITEALERVVVSVMEAME